MALWQPLAPGAARQVVDDPNTVNPACPSGVYWVVESGDSFYAIAQAMRFDLADLLALNPGVNPFNLIIGQRLCLPSAGGLVPPETPPCPSEVFWVIEPGDTLYQIAQATGLTVDELLAANPGLDPNNLRPRTNICLPFREPLGVSAESEPIISDDEVP